jgi:hypothetical protein
MKLVGVISTAILSLALGVAVPAFTQDREQEDKAKPVQEENKAQPEKSAKPEAKPAAQPEKNAKPEEKNAQQEKDAKPEEKNAQEEKNAKPAEKNAPEQHAAAGNGGRIPADRYKANFGSGHKFRVSQSEYSNGRFQYGGYWFGFGGAWPSNWLYTQDVYVVEINGVYYLCNASYPGVNLMITVSP